MKAIARSFGDPWEVVTALEASSGVEPSLSREREAAILEKIERRPSTAEDVASGLGLAVNEVIKLLDGTALRGSVETFQSGEEIYYTRKRRHQ